MKAVIGTLGLLVLAIAIPTTTSALQSEKPADDSRALLEQIRWMESFRWHRDFADQSTDPAWCDMETCIPKHMEEMRKVRAEWNTPEGKARRAAAKKEADEAARRKIEELRDKRDR
jgi:hypothetical protein